LLFLVLPSEENSKKEKTDVLLCVLSFFSPFSLALNTRERGR